MNIAQPDRAITELSNFIKLTEMAPPAPGHGRAGMARPRPVGDDAAILASAQVVEQILNRVLPNWRDDIPESFTTRWGQHREAAVRAIAALERDAEVREILGDDAPRLSASALHPWVWESAGPLWLDGHYRQAVTTAAIKVSAEAQRKTGVKDRSEHDLIVQLFKTEPPKVGHPRLRLLPDDGGKTFSSMTRVLAPSLAGRTWPSATRVATPTNLLLSPSTRRWSNSPYSVSSPGGSTLRPSSRLRRAQRTRERIPCRGGIDPRAGEPTVHHCGPPPIWARRPSTLWLPTRGPRPPGTRDRGEPSWRTRPHRAAAPRARPRADSGGRRLGGRAARMGCRPGGIPSGCSAAWSSRPPAAPSCC